MKSTKRCEMSEGKTKKLINAWLQFMDLEENQKIEVALSDCIDLNNDQFSLKGNRLHLSEDLFKHIKSSYEKEHTSGNTDKARSLYVTFPVYVNNKKNRIPLFGLSLEDIMMGDYSESGWDLSQQPSFSAMRNIVDSFDVLTEDDATKLNGGSEPLSLLSTITSQYFSKSIRSLSELYDEIGSLTNRKHKRQLYLFWRSDTVIAKNLKADLSDALKTEVDSIPLVDQLLYGKLSKDPGQRFVYGRLGKVPAETQREALVHQYNHPLTVVQGPPGSGKTTLIMNAIASYAVQSHLGQRSQLPIVITSSTNKAVDNLRDKFQDMNLGDYYLELGSSVKSKNAKQLIASTIENLQSSTNQDELQRNIDDKRSKITDITSKLWEQTNQVLEQQSNVGLKIQKLEQEIEKLNQQTVKIIVPDLTLSDLDVGIKYLQTLVSQLQGRGILSRLFRRKGLSVKEMELGLQAMSLLKASDAIPRNHTDELLTTDAWIQLWRDVKSVRNQWIEKSEKEQKMVELGKKLTDTKLAEQKLKDILETVEQTLYTKEVHALQEQLFYEILELNRLIAKQNKQLVITSLKRYQMY